MSKSGSRYGRRSNWFKIHCLLSAQSQNGLGSLPETNNNNSTVTNNNNTNSSNSSSNNNHHHNSHSKSLPSTITSHGMGGHGHSGSETDRNSSSHHHHHSSSNNHHSRDRTSSSASSHHRPTHLSNGGPPPFANLAGMSPDSKEQFLSSLNRKMTNPDLYDYFRAANLTFPPHGLGLGPKPFYPDEAAEDMSRTTQSPGSLESPNSEASAEDTKSNIPLFGMPPGSPLEMKPNDLLSFDLLTRDLMKLGYDPLRLWPAMLSSPQSLHQFNPYRFMFPNFPNSAAAAAAAGFPGALANGMLGGGPPPTLPHGTGALIIPPTKLLSAASSAENLSQPPPHQNRRFPIIVPQASSLTLTPPISHHGADEPSNLSASSTKFRKLPVQDQPIDLSAKTTTTNNNNIDPLVRVKGEIVDGSDEDEDDLQINPEDDNSSSSDSYHSSSTPKPKKHVNSVFKVEKLRNSDQENDEHCDGDDESDDSFVHNNNNHESSRRRQQRRRSSSTASSPIPKKMKVSTPLDLTRSTNSNPPPTKIAT